MTGEVDQRWAPFPVQDWSTMPDDPLAPASGEVDPAWGPPTTARFAASTRPWWVPLVVLLCLAVLIGSGTWLARHASGPRTPALSYVPADGAALWQQVATTREAVTQTATQVTESARFVGINGLISGDSFLVTRVLHTDYDHDPEHARLWRTTTTAVDSVGVGTQTTRYYRVRGAVELAGEQTPESITAYEPALVELPADVGPGSTWTGSGTAGDTLDYTSTFRATGGSGGCLDVAGELDLRPRGGTGSASRTTLTRTWCPGRGLVDASESSGATRTVESGITPPAPGPRATTSPVVAWTDPSRWTAKTWDTVTVDAEDRTRPMYGQSQTNVPPVLTASGLVVRVLASPDDLVATTPKTADAWTPAWSAHPGGTVLTLAAFGSVVLVTTSEQQLVAYSDVGQRLWSTRLREVGPRAPVRVSDADAVLVDLSGRVLRFGIADGAERWQADVGSDVNVAPAAGAGLVLVGDRDGTLHALDAATGATRWTRPLAPEALEVVGDRVVLVQDQDVLALEPVAGRPVYLSHFGGFFTALAQLGGRVVVASKTESVVLDDRGRVTARLPAYLTVDETSTHLVGWGPDRVDVLDADARTAATWPTSSVSLISNERPGLATPQGIYLFAFSKGWTFASWTAGG